MTRRQAVQIVKPPVTWILVADGSGAHIYTRANVEKGSQMDENARRRHPDEAFIRELVLVPGMELKTESAHHMSGLQGDAREEIKQHFIKMIAARLNEALSQKSFDKLVLVAPPKMLGELREFLAPAVKKRVAAEMPKDLTHYEGEELLQHLKDSGLESA